MPIRHQLTNDRLAARHEIINHELVIQCDRAADAAEMAVRRVWRQLLSLLRQNHGWAENYRRARGTLWTLAPSTQTALAGQFRRLAKWSHRETVSAVRDVVPVDYLQAVAGAPAEAIRRAKNQTAPGVGTVWPEQRRGTVRESILMERDPGIVSVQISPAQPPQYRDEAAPLREPAVRAMSDTEQCQLFMDLLFPPPPEGVVNSIIFGGGWMQQMERATSLGAPDVLARIIADGIAAGLNQIEIAKQLRPHIQGVQNTARRLARTYGIQVAHEISFRANEEMADITDGYMIKSAGGHNARPDHAARSGTVYFRNPGPGQKGFDVMPRPPVDHGDPAGSFGMKWNCRCVTGDTTVHADARWIMRSWYDGEAIEFRTRNGARLTVTANHPMATPDGFASANFLRQGDHLVSDFINGRQFSDNIDDDVPALENVFQTLAVARGLLRLQRPSALEFHGDGQSMNGYIDVVGPDFRLMYGRNAARIESEYERDLVRRASRPMGGDSLFGFSRVIHPGPLERFGRRSPANRDAVFGQNSDQSKGPTFRGAGTVDAAARDSESVGQRFQRFSGQIALDELFRARLCLGQPNRFRHCAELDSIFSESRCQALPLDANVAANGFQGLASGIPLSDGVDVSDVFGDRQGRRFQPAAQLESTLDEPLGNRSGRHAQLLREAMNGFPGRIATDKIISARSFHLRSFVYSVDTGRGYYMGSASNVAVLQGNCFMLVVLKPPARIINDPKKMAIFQTNSGNVVPDPATYDQWFSRADEQRRRLAVGTRRYSLVQDALGSKPEWTHFIDAKTGKLLTMAELKAESPEERSARVAQVDRLIAQRREQIRQVSTYGFVPPTGTHAV